MKRPIDQEGGTKRAVMWQRDEIGERYGAMPLSRDLHRYAGRVHSLSCMPKRSAIDRRYFAEINRAHLGGRIDFNLALGKGETPIHAAIDGYAQVVADPYWAACRLEIECEMLRQAAERGRRLDAKIDWLCFELEDLLDSGRTFVWDQP